MFRKYPSLYLLIFVVSGILIANTGFLSAGWFLLFCTLTCVAALWLYSKTKHSLAVICFGISLLFFSAFHLAQALYDVGPYNVVHFADGTTQYQIWGTIRDWPLLKADRTDLVISLDSLAQKQPMRVEGNILLRVSDTSTVLQRGDRVMFSGIIFPIHGRGTPWGFDNIRYTNLKGIFGIMYLPNLIDVQVDTRNTYALIAIVDRLRTSIRNALTEALPPVPAAVASGFLIGETRNIPPELYQYFRDSGTLHLLAVSGSNVATILLFATVILWAFPFSRRVRSFILLGVILLFTLLAYAEPSVVRASLMAALVLIAGIVERRIDLNNIIASAALILLLADPTLLFDAGTQMSFLIAWGLVLVVPEITTRFSKLYAFRWYRWIVLPILVCVAAQAIALPITAYYYERITFSGFLSNILIIPLVSASVIGVLILLVAYLIWPMLGMLVGSALTLLMQLTIELIHLFATRFAVTFPTGDIAVWIIVCIYVLLLLAIIALNSSAYRKRLIIGTALFANLLLVSYGWGKLQEPKEPTLLLFAIPGGTAGIISQYGSAEADLIVSGLHARDYDVGERVLEPALEYYHISHLRNILVRDAEYGAIDDIIKLANRYSQDTIRIAPELENSFADAVKEVGLDSLSPISLGVSDSLPAMSGYSAFAGGIALQTDSVAYFFCSRVEQGMPFVPVSGKKSIFILSSAKPVSRETAAQVINSGVSKLICSYLAQSSPNNRNQQSGNNSTIESEAISLVDTGWLRFSLNQARRLD